MECEFIRERITRLRLAKGISEYKLSYDLGHSRGYINNISSGKTLPSMTEFLAICDYFEISPEAFFAVEISEPKLFSEIVERTKKLSLEDQVLVNTLLKRLER